MRARFRVGKTGLKPYFSAWDIIHAPANHGVCRLSEAEYPRRSPVEPTIMRNTALRNWIEFSSVIDFLFNAPLNVISHR
jgi:hypothetical protein